MFCGCGGFSHGFQKAGFDIKYGVDKWSVCRETYEVNHPNTEFIESDVADLDPHEFTDMDVVIGSPPCQHFSMAKSNRNKEKGLRQVKLFLKWIQITQPKIWVMENVPSISRILKRENIGNIEIPVIEILNSANYGTPQIRRRCFAGDYNVPRPTHSKISQKSIFSYMDSKKGDDGILKEWITVEDAIGDLIEKPPDNNIPNHNVIDWKPISDQKNIKYMKIHGALKLDEPSRTILTDGGTNILHPHIRLEIDGKYRRLTVREIARLQGFPDSFEIRGSTTAQYEMIGNAVPPPVSHAIANANIPKKTD